MINRYLQSKFKANQNLTQFDRSPLDVARRIEYANGQYDGLPSASEAVFQHVPSLRHKSVEFASEFVNTVVDILRRDNCDIRR